MPPKVSHGGGCAERAPVTYVFSNPVPASATFPAFEMAAIWTAGSCLLGLNLVVVVYWPSGWASCFQAWLSALAVLRAEWPGAGAAVAETESGAARGRQRADRRRRSALNQGESCNSVLGVGLEDIRAGWEFKASTVRQG